jgi:cytochrome c556
MASAAAEAADERQTDAKAVRQQLRGVYERCEACHERHR